MTCHKTTRTIVGLAGFEPATPCPPDRWRMHDLRKQQQLGPKTFSVPPDFAPFAHVVVPKWSHQTAARRISRIARSSARERCSPRARTATPGLLSCSVVRILPSDREARADTAGRPGSVSLVPGAPALPPSTRSGWRRHAGPSPRGHAQRLPRITRRGRRVSAGGGVRCRTESVRLGRRSSQMSRHITGASRSACFARAMIPSGRSSAIALSRVS
jgi:hypothetical protein